MACIILNGTEVDIVDIRVRHIEDVDAERAFDNSLRQTLGGFPKREWDITAKQRSRFAAYDLVAIIRNGGLNYLANIHGEHHIVFGTVEGKTEDVVLTARGNEYRVNFTLREA